MQRRIAFLAFALAGALSAPLPAVAQGFDKDPFARNDPFAQFDRRRDGFERDFGGAQFAQQDPFGGQQNFNAEQARNAQQTGQVRVDSVQARNLALAEVPGAEYLDMEIGDSGGGSLVYVVHLRTPDGRRVDVLIDAQSGAVVGRR